MTDVIDLSLLVLSIQLLDSGYKQLIEQINIKASAIGTRQLFKVIDSQMCFHSNEFILIVSMDIKLTHYFNASFACNRKNKEIKKEGHFLSSLVSILVSFTFFCNFFILSIIIYRLV